MYIHGYGDKRINDWDSRGECENRKECKVPYLICADDFIW